MDAHPHHQRRDQLQRRLGEAVRRLRLGRDLDQLTLCEIAGVSKRALLNLEHGRGATTATLLSVVAALGAEDWIDNLSPPPTVSPMALLRLQREQQQKQPRRARRRKP